MAKNKKIFCFTHYDLDGVVTYLVTKWVHPGYKLECKALTGTDLRQEVTKWMLDHNFDDYNKVFFLDLDVSALVDLIDHENVIIIDHHKSHVDNKKYTKAVAIVKEYPSACLLAYRAFKKLYNSEFTPAQKILIVYSNDYDSYINELPESRMLNVIFWNTQKSFDTFLETYAEGFVPFTKEQLAIYRIYENELSKIIGSLKIFQGGYADTDGEYRVIMATFAEKYVNDVADFLLSKYNIDVAIIANTKTNHVSFRRQKDSDMKLEVFAKDIANGGGHEYSAGGVINDTFLEFTKTLKPL